VIQLTNHGDPPDQEHEVPSSPQRLVLAAPDSLHLMHSTHTGNVTGPWAQVLSQHCLRSRAPYAALDGTPRIRLLSSQRHRPHPTFCRGPALSQNQPEAWRIPPRATPNTRPSFCVHHHATQHCAARRTARPQSPFLTCKPIPNDECSRQNRLKLWRHSTGNRALQIKEQRSWHGGLCHGHRRPQGCPR
jgi:hypothetical protein